MRTGSRRDGADVTTARGVEDVGGTPATPTTFTLWHREHRGKPWEPAATAGTHRGAVDKIGCGHRRNGEWYIAPSGKTP